MNIHKDDIACPTCGKKGTWKPDNNSRPFCSPRCKLIDLGEWASEKNKIPVEDSDPIPPDEDTPSEKE
jgi:uncharacterized protein